MKRYSIILLAIFAFAAGYVVAQPPVKARIAGLDDNVEYMTLLADGVRLQQMEDSLMRVIEHNRKMFAEDVANRTQYGDAILSLEEQVFSLRNRKGDIFSQINTIEQDWLIANMGSTQSVESETLPDQQAVDTVVEQATVQASRLVDDVHFVTALDSVDYVALQRAQNDELKVIEFVNMFSENHSAMESIKAQYEQTQDAAEASRLYSNYQVLRGLCSAMTRFRPVGVRSSTQRASPITLYSKWSVVTTCWRIVSWRCRRRCSRLRQIEVNMHRTLCVPISIPRNV